MVLASGFRVITQTADQLIILMPGASLLAGWMAVVVASPMLLIFYLTSRSVARVTALERSPAEVRTPCSATVCSGLVSLPWLC